MPTLAVMVVERQNKSQALEVKSRPGAVWGDIGATLARIGVPIEFAAAEALQEIALELPLVGGSGAAPRDIEAKRQVAATIRQQYDDVFFYEPQELPLDAAPEEEAVVAASPEKADPPAPQPIEVQGFDRRTGSPSR